LWLRATTSGFATAALERHYLNFTADELAGGIVGGRNIMSLEGMLWTYGKTGNAQLLQLAEDAWAIQDKFAVDETAILSPEPFYMHSVTFCEMLKLPLLLYAYTGKQKYLDLAMTAIRKVERESMLPDGVPSSAEFLLGTDIYHSHETCDIVDLSWTLQHYLAVTGQAEWADKIENAVYNGGMGAITKDFRSLQYFSSVNQFIATGASNHNTYKHGSPVGLPLTAGSFVRLATPVKDGDVVVLTLPMQVEKRAVVRYGAGRVLPPPRRLLLRSSSPTTTSSPSSCLSSIAATTGTTRWSTTLRRPQVSW
jgi:hypothetical protein